MVKIKLFGVCLLLLLSTGCGLGKVVAIDSSPTGAEVFSDGERIGITPFVATIHEVMPGWMSDGINTKATITINKFGYEEFKKNVWEFSLPESIFATLIKLNNPVSDNTSSKSKVIPLPSDISTDIPIGQNAGKYDIAVVIGNKDYSKSGTPDVDYADRDAQLMRDYLTRTMGYDPANIIYAEDATLTKFYEIFGTKEDHKGKLFKWVKPGQSKVFVYYAGHGAPDADSAEAYFVPVDANPQYLKTSGYRLQTFYDNIAKIGAEKVTVVIDACFSGATPKGSLFKGTSALIRQEKIATTKPANALLMTSASGEQFSSWYPEKQNSLFTYFFLKGLRGGADTNKDGDITVGEMRAWLADQVPYMARRLTGNEQTPLVAGIDTDILVRFKK